ncbi:MAG: molybdopterin synthase catalytic subunit MoaE [Gammaproteobacteria bacterium]|nr:molybdopterin synthase catalytic subunit MoaE [Gammaproteobacteria bacterium]MBT5205106.1 molybdopterin synthase catalytic subunit MoaE [Gammaproteobacteria bacterium]MBT5601375.1 molybdopterin synthase catalytic subunit MoaE [Gammaproteobacteria bacterium]MBT6246251.1 molybdopterin synthase catalytic subunit MoaE [Gammaproteobacteria bacterium]
MRVQEANFSPAEVFKTLREASNGVGAICTFTGLVRDLNDDAEVTGLFLEHYPDMTEKQLVRIVENASQRWPLIGVSIIHRIGKLVPGDEIVLVAVAASHRGEAFSACEFIMDYLKTQATFWKKEVGADGEKWLTMRDSDQTAADRWQP